MLIDDGGHQGAGGRAAGVEVLRLGLCLTLCTLAISVGGRLQFATRSCSLVSVCPAYSTDKALIVRRDSRLTFLWYSALRWSPSHYRGAMTGAATGVCTNCLSEVRTGGDGDIGCADTVQSRLPAPRRELCRPCTGRNAQTMAPSQLPTAPHRCVTTRHPRVDKSMQVCPSNPSHPA